MERPPLRSDLDPRGRVSDVSHLLLEHTHLSIKAGWVTVGHKDKKVREIDLVNEARKPLYEYLQGREKDEKSVYVFTSQRSPRWSEDGIQHWWQQIKKKARRGEAEIIEDITFHDLRHDFAHRARAGGWELEEVADYLGHITNRGNSGDPDHDPLYPGEPGASQEEVEGY